MKKILVTPKNKIHYEKKSFPIISEKNYQQAYIQKVNRFHHCFYLTLNKEEVDKIKKDIAKYLSLSTEDANSITFKMLVLPLLKKILLKENKMYKYLFYNIIHRIEDFGDYTVINVKGDRCIFKNLINQTKFKDAKVELGYNDNSKRFNYTVETMNKINIKKDKTIKKFTNYLMLEYKYLYFLKIVYHKDKHLFLDIIIRNEKHHYHSLLKGMLNDVDNLVDILYKKTFFEPKQYFKQTLTKKIKNFLKLEPLKTYTDVLLRDIDSWDDIIELYDDKALKESLNEIQQTLLLLLKETENVFVMYYIQKIHQSFKELEISIYAAKEEQGNLSFKHQEKTTELISVIKENTNKFSLFINELLDYESSIEEVSIIEQPNNKFDEMIDKIKNQFI